MKERREKEAEQARGKDSSRFQERPLELPWWWSIRGARRRKVEERGMKI